MQTRKNDPCFPHIDNDAFYEATDNFNGAGLTKGEFFAAAILQGMLANPDGCLWTNTAEQAVKMTKMLIVELNKQHDSIT